MNPTRRNNSFPRRTPCRRMRVRLFTPFSPRSLLISIPEASGDAPALGRTPRKKPPPPPGGRLSGLSSICLGVRTLQMASRLGRTFAKSHFASPGLDFLSGKRGVRNDTLLTVADFTKQRGAIADRCCGTDQASGDREPSGRCRGLRFCPHVTSTLWGETCEATRLRRVGTF